MKIAYLSIIILTTTILTSCISITTRNRASVKPINASTTIPSNSTIYTLPKTALRIEVEIEKTVSKCGPFSSFAERYLNTTNVVAKDKIEYKIKSIRVVEFGIPDKTKQYAISAKGDAMAQYISLLDNGIITGINTSIRPPSMMPTEYLPTKEITPEDITFDSVPLREKHLKATSNAMMAELVANSIYKYRKRQSKLIGFEYEHHPCDAPTLQLALNELKKQETAYTEMFTGKSIKQTLISTFEIIPDSINIGQRVLFYFSSENGITDITNGTPVTYEYHGVLPERTNMATNKKEDQQGLYYCNPAQINFQLSYTDKVVLQQRFEIAQLGYVLSLPAKLISKPEIQIEINPTNGALMRIGKLGKKSNLAN